MKRASLCTLIVVAIALFTGQALAAAGVIDRKNTDYQRKVAAGPMTTSPDVTPFMQGCTHRYGNAWLYVTNMGTLGSEGYSWIDCETGIAARGFEFPAHSGIDYLFQAALWIGAVVGDDTLVSSGADGWQLANELYPCSSPDCGIEKRSRIPSNPYYDVDAVSDLDFIAEYTDTLVDPAWVSADYFGRPHIPLPLEVTQSSYSWAGTDTNEFIIVEYSLKSLGAALSNCYVGLFVDADVLHTSIPGSAGCIDDVTGLQVARPDALNGDSIRYAWAADNDGDPSDVGFTSQSSTGAIGFAMLGPIANTRTVSFNWWRSNGSSMYDWGPSTLVNHRDFGTGGGIGTPEGDVNKYFLLSNGEIDYDQFEACLDHSPEGWVPPPAACEPLSRGTDIRLLLSVGPIDIGNDEPTRIAVAIAGGHNLHVNPTDYQDLFDPSAPEAYKASLDFTSLESNLLMARKMFDRINMGDVNWDGEVDIDDVVRMINYVFSGGQAPVYLAVTDVNCDEKYNLLDIVILINYMFRGGSMPAEGCS